MSFAQQMPRPSLTGRRQGALVVAERGVELFALGLSGAEMRVLLWLSVAMGPGNRVGDCPPRLIAEAIAASDDTVRRAMERLRACRLLLQTQEGASILNPVYFVHDQAEHDLLLERHGVAAVPAPRSPRRRGPGKRHLHLVVP